MTEIEKIVWCAKALWRLPKTLCEKYWAWEVKRRAAKLEKIAAKKAANLRMVDEWAAERVAQKVAAERAAGEAWRYADYSSTVTATTIRSANQQYKGPPRINFDVPGGAQQYIDYLYRDEP